MLKSILLGALGLGVGLVVLFFISWLIVHYGGPVSGVGRVFERYAQPHS